MSDGQMDDPQLRHSLSHGIRNGLNSVCEGIIHARSASLAILRCRVNRVSVGFLARIRRNGHTAMESGVWTTWMPSIACE
eukprot:scaffold378684_cov18-Prasinocladus_malaysianus.AAC.1